MHLTTVMPLALTAALILNKADDNLKPLAWPAGPMEVRLAFDRPVEPDEVAKAVGRTIRFRLPTGEGSLEPADESGWLIRIAGARSEHGGRTLVLLTDPHPAEARYEPDLPEGFGTARYDLSGVEAVWMAEGESDPTWMGWLPELNLARSQAVTADSVEHGQAFERFREPGTLVLRTLLSVPEGEWPIEVRSDRPFEAELAFFPLEVGDDHRAEGVVQSFGEPVELYLTIPTGPDAGAETPALEVLYQPGAGEPLREFSRTEQILPWAPAPVAGTEPPGELPEELRGGDPVRGEAVFFGEQGKCSVCHRIGDRGGLVGPDLSDIGERLDPAALFRSIEAPSASIAPEYLPYTVAMIDGRVAVGVVRAEGGDTVVVVGADAEEMRLPRADVAELRPVSTSIMPVGLAGALGQDDLRDLIAFLSDQTDD